MCGDNIASSCAECVWCNKDCQWIDKVCIDSGSRGNTSKKHDSELSTVSLVTRGEEGPQSEPNPWKSTISSGLRFVCWVNNQVMCHVAQGPGLLDSLCLHEVSTVKILSGIDFFLTGSQDTTMPLLCYKGESYY